MTIDLIDRLRKGLEPAFTELVLASSQQLMAVALVYADSKQDAQDILQDAYIIFFQKIGQFRGDEPKAFYGWMKRITINLAISKNRKKYKTMESSIETLKTDQPIDANIFSQMNKDEIMELVFNLPSGYRQVFALFAIEGFSHKEIADKLGIKASTSRSQFIRAKRVLQEKIMKLQNSDVS